MMKRMLIMLLALMMTLSCFAMASAETVIPPDLKLKVKKPASIANNPVIEGESPFTHPAGL